MSPWVIGAGMAALLALPAAAYFWFVRRIDSETAAGLHALAALRWREVSGLIRQAMQQRGLRDAERNSQDPAGDGSRLLMLDGDDRCLLVCKHGMAYRIGIPAIEELVAAMDLSGARKGVLLTQGKVEREARTIAERNAIRIIDGRRLWLLLKPFIDAETRDSIVLTSRRQAMRHAVISAFGAMTAGLLAGISLQTAQHEQTAASAAATTSGPAPASVPGPTPAEQPVAASVAAPAETAAAPSGPRIEADPDDATQQRYQADIAHDISQLPGIGRAYWLTRATLVIDRSGDDALIWPLICNEVERYPSLRTIRVQLNPRPGHDEAVRWKQCRTI